jgi:hypothetical protein
MCGVSLKRSTEILGGTKRDHITASARERAVL